MIALQIADALASLLMLIIAGRILWLLQRAIDYQEPEEAGPAPAPRAPLSERERTAQLAASEGRIP